MKPAAFHNRTRRAEREARQGTRSPAPGRLWPMETKDTFMRFVVIGSVVVVGALALIVRMHA